MSAADRQGLELWPVGDAAIGTDRILATLRDRATMSMSAGRKEIIHIDVRTNNRSLSSQHKSAVSTDSKLLPARHEYCARMVDAWLDRMCRAAFSREDLQFGGRN